MESGNLKKQLDAATKRIQKFFDEEIRTISVKGNNDLSWRFKRCNLIWGRDFTNEVGETQNIIEENAKSASGCEKECEKWNCVCWSFKDGVCGLKQEAFCEKLSEVWDINVVSSIAIQCQDRVEKCNKKTDICEWRPARELDLGK